MSVRTTAGFFGLLGDFLLLPFLFTVTNAFYVKHFITTLLTNPRALNNDALRDRAFASFLTLLPMTTPPDHPLYPFLAIQKEAKGVVLDLGPGTGVNLEYFDKDNVNMIYGAEPSEAMRVQLYEEIKKQGFEGKYKVLECGGEYESLVPALKAEGLLNGDEIVPIWDTVVCAKVLCTVPNHKETIEGLVRLLKPGGKFMFCEHIRNRWETGNGNWAARALQRVSMICGFQTIMCGCDLERDIADIIQEAGDWEDRRLTYVKEWSALPFVFGWNEKRN